MLRFCSFEIGVGGTESLFTRPQVMAQGTWHVAGLVGESIEIAPQRGAHKTHTREHYRLLLKPDDAQRLGSRPQGRPTIHKLLAVVLMITGDIEHRHWPISEPRREPAQSPIGRTMLAHRAIGGGANIASQHQHIGGGGWVGRKFRVDLQMEIAE